MLALNDRLEIFDNPQTTKHLCRIVRGIEKESLRVSPSGHIANSEHPKTLGSALNSPVNYYRLFRSFVGIHYRALLLYRASPRELENIHRFTYRQIGDELLWASSMPVNWGQMIKFQ